MLDHEEDLLGADALLQEMTRQRDEARAADREARQRMEGVWMHPHSTSSSLGFVGNSVIPLSKAETQAREQRSRGTWSRQAHSCHSKVVGYTQVTSTTNLRRSHESWEMALAEAREDWWM